MTAWHLEVRRLLHEVAVEEVDALDERVADRQDRAVDQVELDDAVGDRGLRGSTRVASLEGERLHLVALELGEARGHEHLVEAGAKVDVGELSRRAPVERGGERARRPRSA